MSHTCHIKLDGRRYDLPVVEGTEHELAVDISQLRDQTGYVTLDEGYGNTRSCTSAVTYIDGEQGILRYRGVPIEDLAETSSFVEAAWLVIFGHLPTSAERDRFSDLLTESSMLHQSMRKHFDAIPPNAHLMATLSSMINALSSHEPRGEITDDAGVEQAAAHLLSKVRTIAAASYKFGVKPEHGCPLNWDGLAEGTIATRSKEHPRRCNPAMPQRRSMWCLMTRT
jgi:citrate synthase